MRAAEWLHVTANAAIKTMLAPVCVACASALECPLDSPVCPVCWQGISRLTPPWCSHCGDASSSAASPDGLCARCRRTPRHFLTARSAGRYDGALRQIIHAFKYDQRRMLAQPLARLAAWAGSELLADADAVVPVPLHPWRSLQRGFNQADDLARHLGPPVWRALRRCRAGPPQASLPAARRQANVRGAFALRRHALPHGTRWTSLLRNRAIVLIDDVMTTGETMDVCAGVLEEAGVRTVRALTVARAVTPRPDSPRPPPVPWPAPRR